MVEILGKTDILSVIRWRHRTALILVLVSETPRAFDLHLILLFYGFTPTSTRSDVLDTFLCKPPSLPETGNRIAISLTGIASIGFSSSPRDKKEIHIHGYLIHSFLVPNCISLIRPNTANRFAIPQ